LIETVETPHVRLLIVLAIVTGARMSAILELQWSQVRLDEKYIDLNPSGRHETNKHRAVVPINDRADTALRAAQALASTEYVIEYDGTAPVSGWPRQTSQCRRSSNISVTHQRE